MAQGPEKSGREILPVPDIPSKGKIAIDARKASFPPIKPLRLPDGAPNVVIVLIDDMGFGCPSANGGPVHMPAMEKIAERGLLYSRFHTTALCSPTRQALLTGRNHHSAEMGSVAEVPILGMRGAEATLMRGFTTVRDPGGNSFAIKKLIDSGEFPGHRILPSGPFMSQTGGHADFRDNNDLPVNPTDPLTYWEKYYVVMVADGVPEVAKRSREILRHGAMQIKKTSGGGVSSLYDPLDVFEYTMDEIRAVVEVAENWNTYVLSHVMNDKGVRKSVEAGVKSIEHGFFASEETLKLMKEKGAWLSPQRQKLFAAAADCQLD
jgi:hypothetical protein